MNTYIAILILFTLGGIGVSVWGWKIILINKKQKQWPTVQGEITESQSAANMADIFPKIVFRYEASGSAWEKELEFPSGTQPTPELCTSYIKKYPAGATVDVYYNPDNPQEATLEPGVNSDWMIFAIGILASILGLAFIVSGF